MSIEISFHNLEPSDAVKEQVRERAAKLEALFPRLAGCRITIEALHHLRGSAYGHRVRIDMKVPGQDLVVSRETGGPQVTPGESDVYQLLRQGFDAAERRLKDHKSMRNQAHHQGMG
jgi:ribosome-associated translation inhibitor RaiA